LAALEKCELGMLLGDATALNRYVREKYLHVSRITTGADTNKLGQIAQQRMANLLKKYLPVHYTIICNGKISLQGYEKSEGMPFDLVITSNNITRSSSFLNV
jgi:hypothetical protein